MKEEIMKKKILSIIRSGVTELRLQPMISSMVCRDL